MPIPTIPDQRAYPGRGTLPALVLSVVATLAVIAPVALFFRSDNVDPQVSATLHHIRAGQPQTTTGIAINDRPAAEKFLAQTRGTKAINDGLAAEDQFIALLARLSTLQDAMTRILRDNAALAEQLKALMQTMARRPGVLAMGSEERERRPSTTGSTATAPAATPPRTAHRKDQARLRADGSSGAAERSRASPAPTARPLSPQLPPPRW